MKNLKFGVFSLGLLVAVVAAVSSLGAQVRVQPRGDRVVTMLDGRGPQLGVMVSDVDPSTSLGAGAKAATGGVKIDEVNQDSPADKAGLMAGDVVVEFDGERVRSARQFTRLVQETPEGRSVKIAVVRNGQRQTLEAIPEDRTMTWSFDREPGAGNREPREFFFRGMPNFDFNFDDRTPRRFEYRLPEGFRFPAPGSRFPASRGRLGVSVQSITPELQEYFGAKNGGVLVSSVSKDSAASKAGIKAGDVIVSINGRGVEDSSDLVRELEDVTGEVTIVLLRDRKEMTLKATLTSRSGGV